MVTLVSVSMPPSFCSGLTVGGLEGCSGGLIGGAGKWEVGGGGALTQSDSAT